MKFKRPQKGKEKPTEMHDILFCFFFKQKYNERLLTPGHQHELGKKNFLLSFLFPPTPVPHYCLWINLTVQFCPWWLQFLVLLSQRQVYVGKEIKPWYHFPQKGWRPFGIRLGQSKLQLFTIQNQDSQFASREAAANTTSAIISAGNSIK